MCQEVTRCSDESDGNYTEARQSIDAGDLPRRREESPVSFSFRNDLLNMTGWRDSGVKLDMRMEAVRNDLIRGRVNNVSL